MIYQKYKNLSNKEKICYIFSLKKPIINSNDTNIKLISNFDEFNTFIIVT